MDLSGLIFVALALVWGLVLIPRALRAHDDDARTRPVDASSDNARVLPRQGRTPTAPLAHRDSAGVKVAVALQRRRAGLAARRRRRVLGLLLLATFVVGGGSVAGLLVPWVPAVPAGLVLGFLALARVLVRREHAAWEATLRRLRGGAHHEEEPSDAELVETGSTTEPELHVVARNDQGVAVVSETEDTAAYDARALAQAVGDPAGALWDPLPVTLPTYVTKPRANRSVRTIDLLGPGVSSSGHDAADSALVGDSAREEQEPPGQRATGS